MLKAKKPSTEDVKTDLDKTIEDAEKLEKEAKDTKDIPDDPKDLGKDEEEDKEAEKKPEDEEKEEEEEKDQEEDKDEEEDKKPPKEPDYKDKFINSTKEAQILHAKNKKITEALKEVKSIPEPTEEELKKEYSDWDVMDEFQKKMAKDATWNSRRFNSLDKVTQEFTAIEEWNDKVDKFMEDPENISKNPLLEGKETEFRAFASKPTRRGVDFEDLIKAFFWEESQLTKTHKGGMLPTGSGGDKNIKPKPDKLTVEQGRKLREADYDKWKKYLIAGKIEAI